jgi:hypothetical protein
VQHIKSNLRSDNRILTGSAKSRNYHAQLVAMLDSLKKVQTGEDFRLKNVEIYLFGKVVTVDVLCPILFISCDTPAADKLCGHFQVMVKVSSGSHAPAMFHLTNWMIPIFLVNLLPGPT